MRTGLLTDMHPFAQFIFSILLALFSFFVISLIGAIIAIFLFQISIDELTGLLQNTPDEGNISILKFFQLLQSIGLFLIPSIILAKVFFKDGLQNFGYRKHIDASTVWWVLILMIFGFPLVNLLGEWNSEMKLPVFFSSLEETLKRLEENALEITEAFMSTKTIAGLFYNILLIAILPALGEELFFRGIVQRIFISWTNNPLLGIIIGAFLFSFMHLQFYGFIPRFYLGFIFGLIYFWSGSIWLPILAHFLNNAAAVIILFIYGQEIVGKDIDTLGTQEGRLYYLIISISIVCLALWKIYESKTREGIVR